MDFKEININISSTPVFKKESEELFSKVQNLTDEEIVKLMKIKGKTLDHVLKIFRDNSKKTKQALFTYTGFSFKNLELSNYSQEELEFISDKLLILDALYGALSPFDMIKEYRLDMTMKLDKITLYSFWNEKITSLLNSRLEEKKDSLLLNLASNEFSKMINKKEFKYPIINIEFKEFKGDKYKAISTYAKQARGLMLNYIIKNKVNNLDEIKKFKIDNYSFNEELSNDKNIIFTRGE